MGNEFVAPRNEEVPMVEQEVVRQMRLLDEAGWGAKRIARELGLARNTVRRYLRRGEAAEVQIRPLARCLDEAFEARAVALWSGPAEGNAVVVQQLLATEGVEASVRTVQRVVEDSRRQVHAAECPTSIVPPPWRQLDFPIGLIV